MGRLTRATMPLSSTELWPAPILHPKIHPQCSRNAVHVSYFAPFHRPKVALRGAL